MSYSIVVRNEAVYGGLVVPRVRPSFKVSTGDLVEFLRERLRERDDADPAQPIYSVYVPDPAGNYNVVVGYDYPSPAEVPVGDVLIHVPKAVYARFIPNGDYRDPVEDLWAQVDDAVASADIARAYREEIEIWRSATDVELLIAILI
ncbi:effector binding domain-containing protein [Nocardia stercoris]|uniref:AraC family transcriptional regulator n=1 Tax=Nocardia stercoris TaxID=2483361 RepID=A0A3M2LBB1_9NOCA|nr:effector binding domain-containing protein [Nocardia stercoris]RMI34841.1 AraC family transcriptional regulator [Nocardia stercoris]